MADLDAPFDGVAQQEQNILSVPFPVFARSLCVSPTMSPVSPHIFDIVCCGTLPRKSVS